MLWLLPPPSLIAAGFNLYPCQKAPRLCKVGEGRGDCWLWSVIVLFTVLDSVVVLLSVLNCVTVLYILLWCQTYFQLSVCVTGITCIIFCSQGEGESTLGVLRQEAHGHTLPVAEPCLCTLGKIWADHPLYFCLVR